jgi:plastocyanin
MRELPRDAGRPAGWLPVLTLMIGLAVTVLSPVSAAATRAASATGTVTGHVQLVTPSSRRLAAVGAYPGRVVTPPAAHNTSELANVVVFVKARPTATMPMRASIKQQDEEFVPHLVVITAGSTVDFPNEDLIFHNVFSLSRAGTFDLGRYPLGQSKSRTFSTPGLIKVFCHLHSQMSAMIRVFDHPYFAVPDATGYFEIPEVPSGDYDVVAWHERVGDVTLHASIGSERTASLSFSLPLTDTP